MQEFFIRHRQVFGLPAMPQDCDQTRLVRSMHTYRMKTVAPIAAHTRTQRYLVGWREVATRQGLYQIVTRRLEAIAARLQVEGANPMRLLV